PHPPLSLHDALPIYCGLEGQNGPIVLFLAGFHDKGWDVDGNWIGDATATDANITNNACGSTLAELEQAMADGRTYANIHTVAHQDRKSTRLNSSHEW